MLMFCGIMLFLVPAIIFEGIGGSWGVIATHSAIARNFLWQAMIIAAIIGVSAVQEFVERGSGTPFPYDPPRRLVTSGIYAYVRNPMQLSASLLFLILAFMLKHPWFFVATFISVAYSAGFARWNEDAELTDRFGDDWTRYAVRVRAWFPRWRSAIETPSTIYFAAGCEACSPIGRWLARQSPVALRVMPAELHPTEDLWRVRYEGADGEIADGVSAIARALEHINFMWALLGCMARTPPARLVLQSIIDGVGGGPRLVVRNSTTCDLGQSHFSPTFDEPSS